MTEEEQLQWGSHLPALMACLAKTTGPVLELGVGHFSTPILHAYCSAAQRLLISVEENSEWFNRFSSRYATSSHQFIHSDYSRTNWECYFGVAFIDNSPGGIGRSVPFSALIDSSDFVVVHDYHKDNEEFIGPLLGGLIWSVYKDYEPPTLVASHTLFV